MSIQNLLGKNLLVLLFHLLFFMYSHSNHTLDTKPDSRISPSPPPSSSSLVSPYQQEVYYLYNFIIYDLVKKNNGVKHSKSLS